MSHQNAGQERVKRILRKAALGLPELISRLMKDMRLIIKLYSSYAVILVILVFVSAFSLIGINQIGNRTKELYEERLTAATQILALASEFHAANAATASVVLQSAEDAQARLADVEFRNEQIAGQLAVLSEDMDRYAIHPEDFSSFQIVWNNYLKDWEQIKTGVESGEQLVGQVTGLELARSYYTRNMYNKVEVLNDYLEKWVEANTAL
ncbi:MAG TPA: MCP four helix bundle domain-containing protein, partial [Paenibacillaceae bacterium]